MDMTVRGIGAVVVAELRAAGYLESTIGQYSKTIRALAEYASQRGGVYSLGLGAEFASMTISPRAGRAGRRVGSGHGWPGAGAGHACRLRAGGAQLPGVPGTTRYPRPGGG